MLTLFCHKLRRRWWIRSYKHRADSLWSCYCHLILTVLFLSVSSLSSHLFRARSTALYFQNICISIYIYIYMFTHSCKSLMRCGKSAECKAWGPTREASDSTVLPGVTARGSSSHTFYILLPRKYLFLTWLLRPLQVCSFFLFLLYIKKK